MTKYQPVESHGCPFYFSVHRECVELAKSINKMTCLFDIQERASIFALDWTSGVGHLPYTMIVDYTNGRHKTSEQA